MSQTMGLMCRMLNGFSRRLFSVRIVRADVVHGRLLCFPSLPIGKLKDGAQLSGSCLFGDKQRVYVIRNSAQIHKTFLSLLLLLGLSSRQRIWENQ